MVQPICLLSWPSSTIGDNHATLNKAQQAVATAIEIATQNQQMLIDESQFCVFTPSDTSEGENIWHAFL